jgi:hypothetical protein
LDTIKKTFIADMYQNFHILEKLKKDKLHKNTDCILKENKVLDNPIKIYDLTNPQYISSTLNNLEFDKYYQGMVDKSFI